LALVSLMAVSGCTSSRIPSFGGFIHTTSTSSSFDRSEYFATDKVRVYSAFVTFEAVITSNSGGNRSTMAGRWLIVVADGMEDICIFLRFLRSL
jgi:hypothetical protein